MYIERHEFLVRPGCLDDVVALAMDQVQLTGAKARVLTPNYAQWDHMVLEIAFQDIKDRETFWENWFDLPTTEKFWEQWNTMVLSGGSTTFWEVVEPTIVFPPGKFDNRRTWVVKPGKMNELLELLKGENGENDPWYISRSVFGPKDMVAGDFVSNSMAENEQSWEEWARSEQASAFFEKWYQLVESGGSNEAWDIR